MLKLRHQLRTCSNVSGTTLRHLRVRCKGAHTCMRYFSSGQLSSVVDEDFIKFQLFDVLNIEDDLLKTARFEHVSRDIISDSLVTAKKIAEEKFATHNKKNDANEPSFDPVTGRVVINPEVSQALDAYREAGFFSVHADEEVGGMQLPFAVTACLQSTFTAANCGTCAYPFLTIAAGNMLNSVGTPAQIERYLLPMLEGKVFGTMNLSETQAGSSLGDITTKAVRRDDGTYSISGQKMWISGGDHDLSDNIFHMVLAKVRSDGGSGDTEAGVKGISLFIVPKYRMAHQHRAGERNGVALAGLNHKMGYRGTTNCVMVFGGDDDECIGELLGAEGEGLAAMFHMMNEARISVGLGASALGYTGYIKSLLYARERKQGRVSGENGQGLKPTAPQVPIIQHADVRRMLLAQKAAVEGSLSLGLFGCTLVDKIRVEKDNVSGTTSSEALSRAQDMNLLLETLTPIIKSWPSEWCLEANKWAIQIHGGYGYTRDYDVEQIYRDNRLNMIHEGTNGIQSLDLLGRKVHAKQGRGLMLVLEAMQETISNARNVAKDAPGGDGLHSNADALEIAANRLLKTTQTLLKTGKSNPGMMLANSHEYLNMAGHVVIAWRWLAMETVATQKRHLDSGCSELSDNFYIGKQMASRYFFKHELPKTVAQAELLTSMDDTNLVMKDEYFC